MPFKRRSPNENQLFGSAGLGRGEVGEVMQYQISVWRQDEHGDSVIYEAVVNTDEHTPGQIGVLVRFGIESAIRGDTKPSPIMEEFPK